MSTVSLRGRNIACVCGEIHSLTPIAMAIVIQAFINGDAQRVDPDGVRPMCVAEFLDNLPGQYRRKGMREDRIGYVTLEG